jgi:hypothetical protein
MANVLLSPTVITRESLRILHQKLNFIGTIERQYDDQFAKTGAKIGQNLTIRKPNQYTVRTGQVMAIQDTVEQSVILTVSTIKGVDMQFDGRDSTLTIDKFLRPPHCPGDDRAGLAIEADALTMIRDVYQEASAVSPAVITGPLTSAIILNGRKRLSDALVLAGSALGAIADADDRRLGVQLAASIQCPRRTFHAAQKEGSMGRSRRLLTLREYPCSASSRLAPRRRRGPSSSAALIRSGPPSPLPIPPARP